MNAESNRPPPGAGPTPDVDLGQAALSWAAGTDSALELVGHIDAAVQHRRRRKLVAGATFAVAILLGATLVTRAVRQPTSQSAPAAPVAVAPPNQTLPDGSVIESRAGARISVEFTPQVRRVILHTGEAHFTVTKNAARPFIVAAGGVDVRAVGTAFSVSLENKQVEVVVTEGRVAVDHTDGTQEVRANEPNARTLATLDAGHRVVLELAQISVEHPPVVETLPAAALAEQVAWRVPRIELGGRPLGEVIPIFNRYARERMVLDSSLEQLRLGGALRADNTEALLQLLAAEFGIVTERRDGALYLRRR